mmetsp:Transcript_11726/g.25346  ORF Transcript_11726/g.25346 Transcript_11726/m.25346 type:complete len:228 (-) Transcript_11726:903-1586(-)
MPSAFPRGTIVALCTGSAPSVNTATSACPPSWYAVSVRVSSLITALFLSAPIRILSLACSSCSIVTAFAPSSAAFNAAMFAKFASSAPEKPGVPRAMMSSFTSGASGMSFVCARRICRRPSTSGSGTTTCRSNRPGRTSALSRLSGKLVAPITIMPSLGVNPSSSTSSWFSVIFMYCWSFGLREPPIASISSINTMHGEFFFAAVNNSRTRRAPTPTNISSNSLPLA